jgi:hypothetical protein
MQIEGELKYRMILNQNEFRVIALALAGRLKEKEDIEFALQLNIKLLEDRVKFINTYKEQYEKVLGQAKSIENEETKIN